jgi:hypothetical protein
MRSFVDRKEGGDGSKNRWRDSMVTMVAEILTERSFLAMRWRSREALDGSTEHV